MPQAGEIDRKKSVSEGTLAELTDELDKGGRQWRMAVEFVSGSLIKAISTEDEARQAINALRKRRAASMGQESPTGGRPFCVRCKEEFPVVDDLEVGGKKAWRMGTLNKLKFAPKRIRDGFRDWSAGDIHGEPWLCGACYFDINGGAPVREI